MALELLNVGRLRIASKGLAHKGEQTGLDDTGRYVELDVEAQRREGLYMMGEVARLRRARSSIAELHEDVSRGAAELLAKPRAPAVRARAQRKKRARTSPSSAWPVSCRARRTCAPSGATSCKSICSSARCPRIAGGRAISSTRHARRIDKVYSKWGAFLDEIAFDPTRLWHSAREPALDRTGAAPRAACRDARRWPTPASIAGLSPRTAPRRSSPAAR